MKIFQTGNESGGYVLLEMVLALCVLLIIMGVLLDIIRELVVLLERLNQVLSS